MKHALLISAFLFSATFVLGQSKAPQYSSLAAKADSLYRIKDYKNAASTYSKAFKANKWEGTAAERYNAASSWAMTNTLDSAFAHLNSIVNEMGYSDYSKIATDANFVALRTDKRWQPLMETVRQNEDRAAAERMNNPLAAQLESIYMENQKSQTELSAMEKQYGWQSKEVARHRQVTKAMDSLNLLKVTAILDEHGWLGPDVIGTKGSSTLFLVMQNADETTRERYLPMMREAAKNGAVTGLNLALMEDQLALSQGKRQIYGTQIGRDPETQAYFVLPLEDPDNVDKKREELGLSTMATYTARWQINWDPVRYKQDLPSIEARLRAKQDR